jgi:pullulanase
VAFHNTGPDQVPGVIAMTISDGVCAGESIDTSYDGILVLFNADVEPKIIDLSLNGMMLHPLLQNGSDPVTSEAAAMPDGRFQYPGPLVGSIREAGGRRPGGVCVQ